MMLTQLIFDSIICCLVVFSYVMTHRKLNDLSRKIEAIVLKPNDENSQITNDLEKRLFEIQQNRYAKSYFNKMNRRG